MTEQTFVPGDPRGVAALEPAAHEQGETITLLDGTVTVEHRFTVPVDHAQSLAEARAHDEAGTGLAPGGAGTLTAPMPGVVLSVEAPAGTTVSRGDVVIVLEAMKMNNPLRAPKDGVVSEVLVEAGQNVAFGAPLARIESA